MFVEALAAVTFTGGSNGSVVGTLEIAGASSGNTKVTLSPHSAGGHNTLTLHSLEIFGKSQLDIANNSIIINYTGASPLAAIRTALINGRGAGGFI